ncbi:hypothetical protein [Asticcacaulis sp. AC466]|uniref:hypothetical protein n=1 Tax=Asticcacaulis sp. AC466 TaxID=1282362 RepID=UPI00138B178D|nr:hypothetical protein [Asticcacaulis sp. AC466]
MKLVGKFLLSRLWAFTAILFMVATLNSAYAAVQADLAIIDHQTHGDTRFADGGWGVHCDGLIVGCQGHRDPPVNSSDSDAPGQEHHHHMSESSAGTLADMREPDRLSAFFSLVLRPGEADRLSGRNPATIDQPPRVLSRI